MCAKKQYPCLDYQSQFVLNLFQIKLTNFEVGHNVAVSKGGSDELDNLRPLCSACNKSIGTKTIEEVKKKYKVP